MVKWLLWIGYALLGTIAVLVIAGLIFSLPWWSLITAFLVIGFIALWIFTLWDVWRRADLSVGGALIWTVVVIVFPLLGTLIYFFSRPPAGEIRYRGETIA